MKGASERQSDLSVLTQECDVVVFSLSPDGSANLRCDVSDLKARVTRLTEMVRVQINVVSDAIMQRQELVRRETEVLQTLREVEEGIDLLNDTDMNCIEPSLDAAHQLLQQLENQCPLLSAVQNEINELQKTSSKEELQELIRKSNKIGQDAKVGFSFCFFVDL